jgi:ribosome-associated protein
MTEQWILDLAPYVRAVQEKKSIGIVALDVRALTSLADAFIVCSGRSNRQVSAIAEHVRRVLREAGLRPLHVEGEKEGHWVLLDYGHVIIHVFYEPVRNFYDLESLWADAPRIDLQGVIDEERMP